MKKPNNSPVIFTPRCPAVPRPVWRGRGRRAQVAELARAGMARLIAGLLKAHPDPEHAKCDGPSALPLDKLEPLKQMKAIDDPLKALRARYQQVSR